MATAQERSLDKVSSELGAQLVAGSSVKTALDLNWDDPTERSQALEIILSTLDTVESHLKKKTNTNPIDEAYKSLEVGRQIQSQDITPIPHPQLSHALFGVGEGASIPQVLSKNTQD
jgi:hypothetical protein